MSSKPESLAGVQVLTVDVFGTVVDWHGSISRALREKALQVESTRTLLSDSGISWFYIQNTY